MNEKIEADKMGDREERQKKRDAYKNKVKFKIGDKVRANNDAYFFDEFNYLIGEVVKFIDHKGLDYYAVKFPELGNKLYEFYNSPVEEQELLPADEQFIKKINQQPEPFMPEFETEVEGSKMNFAKTKDGFVVRLLEDKEDSFTVQYVDGPDIGKKSSISKVELTPINQSDDNIQSASIPSDLSIEEIKELVSGMIDAGFEDKEILKVITESEIDAFDLEDEESKNKFNVGDMVKIINGDYAGKTGEIIDIDEETANVHWGGRAEETDEDIYYKYCVYGDGIDPESAECWIDEDNLEAI